MYKISFVGLSLGALFCSEVNLMAMKSNSEETTRGGSPARRPARPAARPSALDAQLRSAQAQQQKEVVDPASRLSPDQIEKLIRNSQGTKRPEPLKLDSQGNVTANAKIPETLYLFLLGALHKSYVDLYLQYQAAGKLEEESSLRSLQKLMDKREGIDSRVTAVPSRSVLSTYNGSTAIEAKQEDPDASGALIRYSFLITPEQGNPTVLKYVIQNGTDALMLIEPSFNLSITRKSQKDKK